MRGARKRNKVERRMLSDRRTAGPVIQAELRMKNANADWNFSTLWTHLPRTRDNGHKTASRRRLPTPKLRDGLKRCCATQTQKEGASTARTERNPRTTSASLNTVSIGFGPERSMTRATAVAWPPHEWKVRTIRTVRHRFWNIYCGGSDNRY